MSLSDNFPAVTPTLLLDFAATGRLDPRITFTRSTTATYYDGVTTAKAEENLTARSQEFNLSPWTVSRLTVGADAAVAPDGTTTADSLTGTAGASGSNAPYFGYGGSVVPAGVVVSASIFAKKSTHDFFQIFLWNQPGGFANFNLATGAIGTAGTTVTNHTMTDVGNSWYRCTMTFTTTATGCMIGGGLVASASATRLAAWTLAGTEVVFVWGAQIEQRSVSTAYTATTTQPITNYVPVLLTAPANKARFDYNPVTGVALGLLIEQQRTNLTLYSEEFDNAAWSKTVYPSTITANQTIAPSGTLSADLISSTTDSSRHGVNQIHAGATAGVTYTASVYVKKGTQRYIVFGDGGDAPWHILIFDFDTGTITSTTNLTGSSVTSVGNGWFRLTCSFTRTNAGTFQFVVGFSNVSSTASPPIYVGSITDNFFLWGAQLEAGAFATTYIATVATTQTRTADSASMTGTNFSSWYNNGEGTLYGEGLGTLSNGTIATINTGTSFSNMIVLGSFGATNEAARVWANNTSQAELGTLALNTRNKISLAYATNNIATSINGASVITDTSAIIPSIGVDTLQIGRQWSATLQLNGTIKKIAYWPLRLTNAQLQTLTRS
jgi:hypothetical protein